MFERFLFALLLALTLTQESRAELTAAACKQKCGNCSDMRTVATCQDCAEIVPSNVLASCKANAVRNCTALCGKCAEIFARSICALQCVGLVPRKTQGSCLAVPPVIEDGSQANDNANIEAALLYDWIFEKFPLAKRYFTQTGAEEVKDNHVVSFDEKDAVLNAIKILRGNALNKVYLLDMVSENAEDRKTANQFMNVFMDFDNARLKITGMLRGEIRSMDLKNALGDLQLFFKNMYNQSATLDFNARQARRETRSYWGTAANANFCNRTCKSEYYCNTDVNTYRDCLVNCRHETIGDCISGAKKPPSKDGEYLSVHTRYLLDLQKRYHLGTLFTEPAQP